MQKVRCAGFDFVVVKDMRWACLELRRSWKLKCWWSRWHRPICRCLWKGRRTFPTPRRTHRDACRAIRVCPLASRPPTQIFPPSGHCPKRTTNYCCCLRGRLINYSFFWYFTISKARQFICHFVQLFNSFQLRQFHPQAEAPVTSYNPRHLPNILLNITKLIVFYTDVKLP